MKGVVVAACVSLVGCVTTRDAVGEGDARLDDVKGRDDVVRDERRACGPEAPGDVVLLDARTGGPVTCHAVTVSREPMSCAAGADCPSEVVFKGLTSARGQIKLIGAVERSRLIAVADGFAPSALHHATSVHDRVLELELAPADGFWLKVLDAEGNYLPDVSVSFKQGAEVIAQLRTNTLANVFFTQRQPFAGQPVEVSAEGYQPVIINAISELGDDGHTLTLRK